MAQLRPASAFAAQVRMKSPVTHIEIPIVPSNSYAGTLAVSDGHVIVGDTSATKCRLAVIAPKTMTLVSNRSVSCDDPLLFGENVMPIVSAPSRDLTSDVRISTYDSKTRTFHVGQVVMHYGFYSDTRTEWTYGDGALWIFDGDAWTTGTEKNARALLLRVSLSSGKVLAVFKMPRMDRILLAADGDGLWFARSNETGWSGREPADLYFLGNRATDPVVVANKGDFVGWLVASDHTARVFFVDDPITNAGEINSVSPARTRAMPTVVHLGANTNVPREDAEEGFDAEPVLTTQRYGLIFISPLISSASEAVGTEQVFTFDSATGHLTKIATFATPFGYLQANIVYNGSLYLLIGGEQSVNYATLYRVKL
jgi:hypothetical protein